ncbi:D-serine dehydratase-like domain containing protein [Burkholderia sp. BT03]|nr:D-serine dehydratase-like domain containing protein [Burkholderia sp. BT03]SKD08323.1 D-serine deaminase, pyridoxal phosphate-dependent [Paraburkholderia hospita]
MSQRPDNTRAFAANVMNERIAAYGAEKPGDCCKGVPPSFKGNFSDIGSAGLSLAEENLPMPVALLRKEAMRSNREWMRRFLDLSGLSIAPHGKTVMSPEIFQMQMQDGAWGMTAATAQQLAFFAHLGIRRVILANQLVGAENIRLALDVAEAHPDFVFHCLIDGKENADALAAAVKARCAPSLNVLLEIGAAGGRTGTRSVEQAMELACHVASLKPWLALSGIECYEGIVPGDSQDDRERAVVELMRGMRDIASRCDAENLFSTDEILLTAGGSEFFDMVGEALSTLNITRPQKVVIRSGCYIAHDSIAYERAYHRLVARSDTAREVGHPLQAALEIWAAVQSRPESGLAFATLGKRDISYDWDLPVPLKWLRPGVMAEPVPLPAGHRVTKLNDQHAYLDIPADSPLRMGDLIGFGISHVCTTFDKWRCLLLVDDSYHVTGAVRTFF